MYPQCELVNAARSTSRRPLKDFKLVTILVEFGPSSHQLLTEKSSLLSSTTGWTFQTVQTQKRAQAVATRFNDDALTSTPDSSGPSAMKVTSEKTQRNPEATAEPLTNPYHATSVYHLVGATYTLALLDWVVGLPLSPSPYTVASTVRYNETRIHPDIARDGRSNSANSLPKFESIVARRTSGRPPTARWHSEANEQEEDSAKVDKSFANLSTLNLSSNGGYHATHVCSSGREIHTAS
ncbi:hypothetical protein CBL_01137 [Carabus blaptoides fortunei]